MRKYLSINFNRYVFTRWGFYFLTIFISLKVAISISAQMLEIPRPDLDTVAALGSLAIAIGVERSTRSDDVDARFGIYCLGFIVGCIFGPLIWLTWLSANGSVNEFDYFRSAGFSGISLGLVAGLLFKFIGLKLLERLKYLFQ